VGTREPLELALHDAAEPVGEREDEQQLEDVAGGDRCAADAEEPDAQRRGHASE
jgi:hypothetical protein